MSQQPLDLPIRASPYQHQLEACYFVLKLFGLFDEGEGNEEDFCSREVME